jgi:hypothetical protein
MLERNPRAFRSVCSKITVRYVIELAVTILTRLLSAWMDSHAYLG